MGTPADVVKARIMNQPTDEKGRGLVYKNSLDCFITTVKGEGFFGKKNVLRKCFSDFFRFSFVQGISSVLVEDGSLVPHILAFIRTNS